MIEIEFRDELIRRAAGVGCLRTRGGAQENGGVGLARRLVM